jgi:hypothetical protein
VINFSGDHGVSRPKALKMITFVSEGGENWAMN